MDFFKMAREQQPEVMIPEFVTDPTSGTTYKKGRFFGKGGFAKCYELTDTKSNSIYAGKIVPKSKLTAINQREKMTQEITIHRSLKHQNIVEFHSFFEDTSHVFIVLELCRRRSMMELQKRRKNLTEPEVRYFLRQILIGVDYLHKRNIIHRDLKLGNLFLNDDLVVKIGDFGLAARVEYKGERKSTLCGTPNYIAPEILTKKGHSFEVDVWSIGCIMYTLFFGKPPFEATTLDDTYSRIKRCQYGIPAKTTVSKEACELIKAMLKPDPKQRPTVEALLNSDFLNGYTPRQLPISCLTTAPRFTDRVTVRKPLLEVNGIDDGSGSGTAALKKQSPVVQMSVQVSAEECYASLRKLTKQLNHVLQSNPGARGVNVYGDEMTDPAAQPIVWVSKWVDYCDKYGFGYQLCDESVGVVFNDNTKIVMLSNNNNVHYIAKNGEEAYHTMEDFPTTLDKKMKLLSYFRRYMSDHLVKAGASVAPRESDSMSRIPCMFQWFRTPSAVIMHLTNGTVQINFSDHTKVIMCPHMGAITYIGTDRSFRTYRFSTIVGYGCCTALEKCMKFAAEQLPTMQARRM